MSKGLGLLKAAKLQFEAKRAKAEVNLKNYLDNPVGVGEHGDLVGEVVNLVEAVEHAEACSKRIDTMIESGPCPNTLD